MLVLASSVLAAATDPASSCTPLYKHCHLPSDLPCCSGTCIPKGPHFSQCRDDEVVPTKEPIEADAEKEAIEADAALADEGDGGGTEEGEAEEDGPAIGSLGAVADPDAWVSDDDAPPCTLSRIAAVAPEEGEAETPELLEFSVPSMSIELKTEDGLLGLNLCGAATLPESVVLPKANHEDDATSVDCQSLYEGTQPAYFLPFSSMQTFAPDADEAE